MAPNGQLVHQTLKPVQPPSPEGTCRGGSRPGAGAGAGGEGGRNLPSPALISSWNRFHGREFRSLVFPEVWSNYWLNRQDSALRVCKASQRKVHFSNSFIRRPAGLLSSNTQRKETETWEALRSEEPIMNRRVRNYSRRRSLETSLLSHDFFLN